MMGFDKRVINPAIEQTSRSNLLRIQEQLLTNQVRRCYQRIPFYQERWPSEAAEIDSIEDFRRTIPYTSKQDFLGDYRELRQDRIASPGSRLYSVHLTSGTTGLGQETHPLTRFDDEALGSMSIYMAAWAGLEPGDSIGFTFPVGLQAGGLQQRMMADKYGLHAIFLAPYGTEEKIDYLRRFEADALIIAPAYLTRFTTVCEQNGIDPKKEMPNLKTFFVAGEPYPIDWAQRTMEFWGADISEWYGLMQAGVNLAFSCERGVAPSGERGVLHCMEHRILCEVLDPVTDEPVSPGEDGELVITVLFREAFPVVRFRTGDRVHVVEEPCPCGRPFMGIEAGTVARYDDMMKIRSQNVWPDAVDSIVFEDDRIEEYAGTVFVDEDGREQVEVAVEFRPSADINEEEKTAALGALMERLKRGTNVSMNVREVEHMSLPRFEFKVRRWSDERRERRQAVRYTE